MYFHIHSSQKTRIFERSCLARLLSDPYKTENMKRIKYFFAAATLTIGLYACEDASMDDFLSETQDEAEIVAGLKEALRVGTDTSVSIVSALDGYYKDAVIKIFLPPEADVVYDGIQSLQGSSLPGASILGDQLDAKMEDVVLGVNRAAEVAAKEAKPIFWDAITNISIADGSSILFGEDTAATSYLKTNTFDDLTAAYSPYMNDALDQPLVGNVSANDTWDEVVTTYNTAADNFIFSSLGLKRVDTDLGAHVTRKGLDGLFHKVAEEEKNIRKDPLHRVTEILEKIFGKLD